MRLQVSVTDMPGVMALTPAVAIDSRGEFFESFNVEDFAAVTGVRTTFVQDNQVLSDKGVLRGLHYQLTRPQGKLVRVVSGSIYDVVVDLRRSSPNCGRWAGMTLDAESRQQLWIPPGFAHGYLALSARTNVIYKTTEYWYPKDEKTIAWNDPDLDIAWPITERAILSERDRMAGSFRDAELYS